jgi:hypothetical protein
LPGNEHLAPRGGFSDHSRATASIRRLDGESITQRAQIYWREDRFFIIGGEEDGIRGVQAGAGESQMHSGLVPGTRRSLIRVDAIDGVIAGPLDDGNKTLVRLGSPVEKSPKGDPVLDKGV